MGLNTCLSPSFIQMDTQKTQKKILYIEDSVENRLLVRRILESHGYSIYEAEDAREGISMAQKLKPDLILMDINLPGLSGCEAATRLKSMDEFIDTPIVALTAKVLEGDRERAVISGCDGYIAKPIDVDTFVESLDWYLTGERDKLTLEEELAHLRQYSHLLVNRLEEKIEISLTDELTAVGNRRYAQLRFAEELARCRRFDIKASLLLCDIDFLKKINMTFDYDAGNYVLKETAKLLSTNRRKFDILARFDKDEFILFLYNVDANMARKAAERFISQVATTPYVYKGVKIEVAMTIGVFALDINDKNLTEESLLEIADTGYQTLYHKGGKRVFLLGGGSSQQKTGE